MGEAGCYLMGVNLAGILLVGIKRRLRTEASRRRMEVVLAVAALAGGAAGVLAALLVADRKADKNNMMARVLIVCAAVIQIVILLMARGFHREELTFAFWEFFGDHRMFCLYLAVVNLVTLAAFGIDKRNAVKNRPRIRIVTLLGLSFAGGSAGGLIGMYVFRHKTRKNYFAVGIPMIMVMQAAVIFYLMNWK